MGVRRTGRQLALKLLYQCDISKLPIETVVQNFFEDTRYVEKTIDWSVFLAKGVANHIEDLDSYIETYAKDWDIDRLHVVDKVILRIAFFELRHTETDANIVIDESVEITKKYSTLEASKFINGILGKYLEKECLQD